MHVADDFCSNASRVNLELFTIKLTASLAGR
jgi:hypothetical protein